MIKIIVKSTYDNMKSEIEQQDKQIDKLRCNIAKQHEIGKENSYLRETNEKYILTIKDLRKKVRFLNKREKKLQTIEMIFKNQPIDLEQLSKIVLEEK